MLGTAPELHACETSKLPPQPLVVVDEPGSCCVEQLTSSSANLPVSATQVPGLLAYATTLSTPLFLVFMFSFFEKDPPPVTHAGLELTVWAGMLQTHGNPASVSEISGMGHHTLLAFQTGSQIHSPVW